MKREIKFGGKTVKTLQWIFGDLDTQSTTSPRIMFNNSVDNCIYGISVIPETVGQFTGLHDKNGNEIYEGDIIRTDGNNFTYEVIYNEKSAAFIGKRNSRVFGLLDLYESDTVCREIIDNIHDNKELLTQN